MSGMFLYPLSPSCVNIVGFPKKVGLTAGSVCTGIIFIAVVGRHMAGVMKTDDDTTDNLTRDNKDITEEAATTTSIIATHRNSWDTIKTNIIFLLG